MENIDSILKKLPIEFQKYNIANVAGGASKKRFYRIDYANTSYILTDFNFDAVEYENYLKVYDILKDINISIPKILDKFDSDYLLISEDFGNLRYDKIIEKNEIKELLCYAVDSLIVINNALNYNNNYTLQNYNFKIFKKEIMELPEYYMPYINKNSNELSEPFFLLWKEAYNQFNFEFNNFVHKDFNINNLIFLPNRKKHLKCGIIDFQGAFWGESCWDLFSLLEDSRILYNDNYNEFFIKYFYSKINHTFSIEDFKIKYYFLSSARQTRLLGRWIKLSKEFNQKFYLKFIPITQQRLKKSLKMLNNNKLTNFYNKYLFEV